MSRPTVLVAGGGTGGHVFPGLAVAEAMRALADVEVVFCGTARGIEARVVPARGFRLETLDVLPIKGGGVVKALRGAAVAASATARSLRTVSALRPRAALSMGGYASGPVTLAAAILGVPVAVLESNSTPGLANRILGHVAGRAYVAWEGAEHAFRPAMLRGYGVPLREGFHGRPYIPSGTERVLVMGGSQGARALNERLPGAIARLCESRPGIKVVHQAGRGNEDAVRAAYAQAGAGAHASVVAFIDDVAGAVANADLVVARAGAVTIAEVTAIGRASVLIPLPHAADDHQTKNAEELARSGAAVFMRQDAADENALASCLAGLLSSDSARVRMADAARARGRPHAAREVAADFLAFASIALRAGRGGGAGDPVTRAPAGKKNGAAPSSVLGDADAGAKGRVL